MKIVLDANVIIAAFAARGLCESIMEVCLSEHEILLCDELLEEILRNLRQKIKLSAQIVDEIILPAATRKKIIEALELTGNKEEKLPKRAKVHGTSPA